MTKLAVGDIFEIRVNLVNAYFQCVHSDKLEGEIIKVFNSLHEKPLRDVELMVSCKDYYYVVFPLKYAIRRKIVVWVGNVPLPNNFEKPRFTRNKHIVDGEFKGWQIIDTVTEKIVLVQKLSEEQKNFSPSGIVNDTCLIERLEEGWSLNEWV